MKPAPSSRTPAPDPANGEPGNGPSVAVVIPTRSRPKRLRRCLEHLAKARQRRPFPVYVCDSSPEQAEREAVREVCDRYEWAHLRPHEGSNITAARNACTEAGKEDLLINVDDDLEVEPEAIKCLVDAYAEGSGPRIVSGSLSWDGTWTRPRKMRPIGYARPVDDGESPDFVLGAFFLYPRRLGLALPWNERLDESDDIFMGALWRSKGVSLMFEPRARALHPDTPSGHDMSDAEHTAAEQKWHIYVLLFESLIAEPDVKRAISYETLGFLASAKLYLRHPTWAWRFLRGWIEGHLRLLADWRYLRSLKRKSIPAHD